MKLRAADAVLLLSPLVVAAAITVCIDGFSPALGSAGVAQGDDAARESSKAPQTAARRSPSSRGTVTRPGKTQR